MDATLRFITVRPQTHPSRSGQRRPAFTLNLERMDETGESGPRRKSFQMSIESGRSGVSLVRGPHSSLNRSQVEFPPLAMFAPLPVKLAQSWVTPLGVFLWLECPALLQQAKVFFVPSQNLPCYVWALIWLKCWREGEPGSYQEPHDAIHLSWGEVK